MRLSPLLFVFLFALIALAFVLFELVRRSQKSPLVSQYQVKLRILIAIMIIVEIAMMLAGSEILQNTYIPLQIVYWAVCVILALLIVMVAIVDIRCVMTNYLVERKKILFDDDIKEESRRE